MASPMYFTKVSWELWCVMRFLNYLNTILVEYVNFLADRVLLGSSSSLSSSVLMLEEDERTTYPSRTSQFFARVFLGWSSSSRSSVLLCLRLARKRPIPAERLTFLPYFCLVRRILCGPQYYYAWGSRENDLSRQNVLIFCQIFTWLVVFLVLLSTIMLEGGKKMTHPGRTFKKLITKKWSCSGKIMIADYYSPEVFL